MKQLLLALALALPVRLLADSPTFTPTDTSTFTDTPAETATPTASPSSTATPTPTYSITPVPGNPSHYWPLTLTAMDIIGNDDMENSAPFTTIDGEACSGPFSETDFWQLPQTVSHEIGNYVSFTVEVKAWLGPPTTESYGETFFTCDADYYVMSINVSAGNYTSIYWSPYGGEAFVVAAVDHPENVWHTWDFVADATDTKVYLDGMLLGSGNYHTLPDINIEIVPMIFRFGRWALGSVGTGPLIDGYLKDLKIYNVSLTGNTPTASPAATPGTRKNWDFYLRGFEPLY